jgi:hypothetical protein
LKDAQDARRNGHVSLIIRIGVATAAIIWAFHGQNWAKLAEVFRGLNLWYFGLSLATFAVAQVLLAVRWWLLLRAQSIYIDVRAAIRLFFLGLFYNNVMPGSVGGDLLKAWYIAKHTDKRLEGVLSVFVDRVVGLAGLVFMAIFAYLVFVRGHIAGLAETKATGSPGWLSQHQGVILWAGVVVVAVPAIALVHPYGRLKLRQVAGRAMRRGMDLLRRVKDALVVYCSKPVMVLSAFILTFISQSIVIASFWLLGRNLAIEAGPKYYFVVFPVMWVVGAVPISIAGLGVVEGGIPWWFKLLAGTPAEPAMALALCQRFVWVLASLPGGLVHLLGAHLPREISVDGEGSAT